MFETSALDELQQAAPDAHLTLVLRWQERPDIQAIAALPTRQERRTALNEAYARIKRPVLELLADHPAISYSDLAGSSDGIAVAPASSWQGVRSVLAARPDVLAMSNAVVGSTAGAGDIPAADMGFTNESLRPRGLGALPWYARTIAGGIAREFIEGIPPTGADRGTRVYAALPQGAERGRVPASALRVSGMFVERGRGETYSSHYLPVSTLDGARFLAAATGQPPQISWMQPSSYLVLSAGGFIVESGTIDRDEPWIVLTTAAGASIAYSPEDFAPTAPSDAATCGTDKT